jgi:hypothetical protein
MSTLMQDDFIRWTAKRKDTLGMEIIQGDVPPFSVALGFGVRG